jgi:hypothetical protein
MKLKYLLFAPFAKKVAGYELTDFKKVKNSPYFFDIDIDTATISKTSLEVGDTKVSIDYFLYDQKVILAECLYDLGDRLTEATISLKEKINNILKEKLLASVNYKGNLVEEYSVILVGDENNPTEFVKDKQFLLARLMRNLDNKVELAEAKDILYSKVSYTKGDLTIVDWEGAIIFAKDGDFESDIELLKVGNYQLLRYRMLDSEIEDNLILLRNKLEKKKKSIIPSGNSILRQTVDTQLSLLLDFDKVDQSLLLVGDWYSSKLYKLIVSEFYLNDWKTIVKDRLESLSSIDETMRGNLTFSWERFLDIVSIVGWAVLLVGYFWLYFKDAGY